ncbi:hypothetical protein M405DRAFT_819091 [Rhizopogon salebrosus TDB-379]|nr:hypothetical protein M405DRAFT_819091 [Rhizopogon salebrosus TDB-379]
MVKILDRCQSKFKRENGAGCARAYPAHARSHRNSRASDCCARSARARVRTS